MGCAPSIHVSQSGVFYCREGDIREGSSPRPRESSASEIVDHIRSSSDSGSHLSSTSSSRNRAGNSKKGQSSQRGSSIEAETQSQFLRMERSKAGMRELMLGPMKLYQPPMQVMLVFAKEDAQTESFIRAAERGGYQYQMCKSSEEAMALYLAIQPEIIVIDLRGNSPIDGESLCRSIRLSSRPSDSTVRPLENSIIIGVTKANPQGVDEPVVFPILKAGFDRRFVESANVGSCYNELLMLEQGEVSSKFKLRAATALFKAMEHTHDAVEISSFEPDRSEYVEYVNPAYKEMTGYWQSEVIGYPHNHVVNREHKPELYEAIQSQLTKGQDWEGQVLSKKRNGEQSLQHVHILPVLGKGRKVEHHVTVRRELSQLNSQHNQLNMNMNVNMRMETPATTSREQVELSTLPNGGLLARRRSTTTAKIEAPITKVINMLNAAQENSPTSVVQALDRVVEILRQTELYSPFNPSSEDDVVNNELVGGLISNGRRRSTDVQRPGFLMYPPKPETLINTALRTTIHHLPEAPPEVLAAMTNESDWDFDILKLEKASNHRPLSCLGLRIMNRFRVCETLNNISQDVLKNWLQLIEANYHKKNAYHNSTHAADVLHATAVFLSKEKVKSVLEPHDSVAALIAAVVHDVDHPGYTNSFLCNEGNELAVLYNDIAVLESHHAALAFKLTTRDDKSNIFKELSQDEYRTYRQAIIDMIMATEMTRHFEHLSKFVNSINKRRSSSMDEVHSVHSGRDTPESTSSVSTILGTPENRTLIKRMLIKCADIANPARPQYLCKVWAYRIAEEYFSQTDEEKKQGLPVVMPVFDRVTCNVPRSQVWFIDYFVSDLYDAWDAFAHVPETIQHLASNYEFWKHAAEDLDAKSVTTVGNSNTTLINSSDVPSSPSTSLTSS